MLNVLLITSLRLLKFFPAPFGSYPVQAASSAPLRQPPARSRDLIRVMWTRSLCERLVFKLFRAESATGAVADSAIVILPRPTH